MCAISPQSCSRCLTLSWFEVVKSNPVGSILSTKAALLIALMDGPGHGLELIARLEERSAGTIKLHQGSTYPALAELAKARLIRVTKTPPAATGGRPRIIYQLTTLGSAWAFKACMALGALYLPQRPAAPLGT